MELNKEYEILSKEQVKPIVSDLIQRTRIGERVDFSTKHMKFAYKVAMRSYGSENARKQMYNVVEYLAKNETKRLICNDRGDRGFHLNDIIRNVVIDLERRIQEDGFVITPQKEKILFSNSNMNPREKEFTTKYFGLNGLDETTYAKIAEEANVSGSYVGQVIKTSINRIKRIPLIEFDGFNIVYGTPSHIDRVKQSYENSKNNTNEENHYMVDSLNIPIKKDDFGVRTSACLKKAGIETIYDLTRTSQQDLLKIKNMGRKGINEIKDFLQNYGIKKL